MLRVGAGQRQEDPRTAEWLTDWLNNGLLALNAFRASFHMPRMGTENIKRLLFAPHRSLVAMDLGAAARATIVSSPTGRRQSSHRKAVRFNEFKKHQFETEE